MDKKHSASVAVNKKKYPAALIKYLEAKGVSPKILEHKTVYTAFDTANTLRRKMDEIVKSLLVKADNYYYLVCLPAHQNLDFKKIKTAIEKAAGAKVKVVQIPSEKVMAGMLKLKDEGLSAFGGFHKLPVIMEKKLVALKKAVFPSGSFNHSVEMGAQDFLKLENAILASFGVNKKVNLIKIRPTSSFKMLPGGNKNMAKKKKAAKKTKKKVAKKKKK
ncbi:MAG TPA: YbaK/EbsC family protein [Candidatus Methylomirabilis sp.]|nr:YbaK/EbsC family protein [Candidatus Methylomirabilis sp.]